MSIDEKVDDELALEMSLEEMAMEVIDMLGVALYFAGAKKPHIEKLIELYSSQMDKFYELLPEDAAYGRDEMIEIIKSLKNDYPQFFHS
ncbi:MULTISPECIES: hypothetical protein [Helicobacter]|uniref:Uncharacterized protein n=2 Tax=Helicobacter typhlonius TaxID=76936 RepID=A0A099UE68_9HELI|nr:MULTISPECIES: hypothetical protein [Helicobacter]TLD79084.1 hypothetical protein LS75_001895 [Helicobacter typhlonius]TLD89832.1 hypothetical protein LS67_002100 [Helicobacter sp. MIT 03-1616]CUU40394.1 FIG00712528: Hypothetical protein [Helicobacter typhlonius]HCD73210.1 hypothetical protein [Helicobacter sp.]